MEFLLLLLTLLTVILICKAVKLESFIICWFAGFSYITCEENFKEPILVALTVIPVASVTIPVAKKIKYYEVLFAVGIQLLTVAVVSLEIKALKFL
ncbi:hypothetical protein C7457_1315 [Thermovibrio guaymasensis]|uniref:Uncharacterized protein n=1 Tax=Thermovibrio guaymasensis TaxID=240167 RepID=A0A420W6Z3_9BACT|nr:hypothetical protein [Thermovibrio guaymasensis]RKQ61862.1 hypothetical protein C7457_1315 [Thermovibrio guaymasensis]